MDGPYEMETETETTGMVTAMGMGIINDETKSRPSSFPEAAGAGTI